MTSAADQYRALVAKLESINPSEPVSEAGYMSMPVADIQAATGAGAVADAQATSNTAPPQADGTSGAAPAEYAAPASATDSNQVPTIEASTFSQAYAQAAKQGLKTFKWTGTYAVKAQPPVQTQPKPTQTKFQPPANVTKPGPNATVLKPGGGVDVNKLMTQQAAPANTNRPEFKPFR